MTLIFAVILYFSIPKVLIVMNGPKNIVVEFGQPYQDPGAKAFSKSTFKNNEIPIETNNSVDTSKLGEYSVLYKAKYNSLVVSAERKVFVIDIEKPKITLNKKITACKNNSLIEVDATAIDNHDGDISQDVKYHVNGDKVIIMSVDSSDNKSELVEIINYIDDEAPKISLNGNKEVIIYVNSVYKDDGATAYDSCDGDITSKIKVSGSVNSGVAGKYIVTYSITDSANKESKIKRTVNVIENNTEQEPNHQAADGATIYLTFDDGPGPYTETILSILDNYGIKATFFVTNQMGEKYQYLINKEYQKGHTVGIHTYSHKWSIYDTLDAYLADFDEIQNVVIAQTGTHAKYFRFPGGTSNHLATVSMTYLSNLMTSKGYTYYDWDVSVEDAGACAKKKEVERTGCVINYFKSGLNKNRSTVIVLMHDIKKSTRDALPSMIEYGLKNGYTFKAIDGNTPLKQFKPYN